MSQSGRPGSGTHQWNSRFSVPDYVYGTKPNDFLVASAPALPPAPARVVSLGEGEGRNAVYLASLGYQVTAVDASDVGLRKAQQLAAERGVPLETVVSDLADFPLTPETWDAVVCIFCHLPMPLRRQVHRAAVASLRPGGVVVLEAYTPAQLSMRTGGPPLRELLYTADELREDFEGLELSVLLEREREVVEGKLHTGRAAVVQLVGRKPVR
ncbi:class I SAM-dependent methyltransferase [Pyxidicoccus xibeiensis]|uniref:class I SAM-dependent methyltransferase n=1 Tax=Pyxidicoccus xibeiensis TaxID=2906759 RepID=UPI0020A7C4FD|nr:class I SAM-dependent methyltransferase [Pyxidicoccus xibeiensis]MCP3141442.1 class I SAM-dependent methyltransferase [Pyxidicoccus xibeiensis]